MEEVIEKAAEQINRMQHYQKEVQSRIKSLRNAKCDRLEERLCIEVAKKELDCKVAAVDSGFVVKSFYSVDLLLVKAKAAVFEYGNNVLKKAQFWPELEVMPKPILLGHSLERDELNAARSLYRLKEEIGLAKHVLERFKPDVLLLDGSIVPQQADKPRNDSELRSLYKSLILDFEELYRTAEERNCLLVGVIEDSRGARFKRIIEESFGITLNGFSDVSLANVLLNKNERTAVFNYSSEGEKHYVLSDFSEEWRNRIFAFYLKPSEIDLPIRVEFIANEPNKIASIILSLSSFHKEYAYPSVLIEADMRSRVNNQEIEMVLEGLTKRIKGEFTLMRRERRPFL